MEQIDLSPFFLTHSQANDFMVKLRTVIDNMYTVNFNLERSITTTFGIQKSDIFLTLLRQNNINVSSTNALQAFLQKILETAQNLPVVSLTLAYEPSNESLIAFAQWFLF